MKAHSRAHFGVRSIRPATGRCGSELNLRPGTLGLCRNQSMAYEGLGPRMKLWVCSSSCYQLRSRIERLHLFGRRNSAPVQNPPALFESPLLAAPHLLTWSTVFPRASSPVTHLPAQSAPGRPLSSRFPGSTSTLQSFRSARGNWIHSAFRVLCGKWQASRCLAGCRRPPGQSANSSGGDADVGGGRMRQAPQQPRRPREE